MSRQEERRGKIFVDWKFQFNLAWHYLLVVAFFFAAGLCLVFAPSAFVLFTSSDAKSLEPAVTEFFVLHKRVWPAVIFTLAGVFFYSFLIGHRIGGPVFRVNEALRRMLRGDFPDSVRFRKPDYFHETAKLLEDLSGSLSAKRAGEPAEDANRPRGETRP